MAETTSKVPFQKLVDGLIDTGVPFSKRQLYRFSDLETGELNILAQAWERVPLARRQALMADLEEISSSDMLLSFEAVGRHAMNDQDPKVRQLAVRIMNEYESTDLATQFVRLMERDSSADVRAESASALGRYVYLGEVGEISEAVLDAVEAGLLRVIESDDMPVVRRRALESLSFSSRKEVPPLIEKAFSSGDQEWMESALFAMGRSVDERWEDQVMAMLTNIMPALRAEAARAAGELELNQAVPFLSEMIEDTEKVVREAAIWSLSQIGGEEVRETIENLLDKTEDREEIDLVEAALDNLYFTEDTQLFSLFDLSPEDVEDVILDVLEKEEVYQTFEDDEAMEADEKDDEDDEDILD